MKKRVMAVLSVLLILAIVFTGCAAPAQSSEPAQTQAATEAPKTEAPATDAPATTPGETASTGGSDKELPKGDWYIGLANGYMGNTWRAQYVEAFEAKCEELKQAGIIGNYVSASTVSDVTEQLNQINNMIADGVDCIQLNPISPASVVPIKEICDEAGVLLVINTDPAAVDAEMVEVLCDNKQFFEIMTKWFIDKLDGKGNIVQITGTPGMPATIVRQAVAEKLLAETDIKVLGSAPGSWSQTESQTAMATFLSTYDNIDGVLTEDVMAEGIIRAYETAGVDVPVMTGDYVMSFFKKWETMPELDACATTFQPHAAAEGVSYAVRILNGWELDKEVLGANPLDETMNNAINIPPSYCITKEKPSEDEEWLQGYDLTEFISLDEALELGADLSDTASLGKTLSDEEWNAMFK